MRRYRFTLFDVTFDAIVYLIVGLAFIVTLYPFLYLFSASVSEPSALMKGEVILFPKGISFVSFKTVFESPTVWRSYYNTLWYTAVGTFLNVIFTFLLAYPLSRRKFIGKSLITFFIIFTMFFSGGLIPKFILIAKLGLYNTRWAIPLPLLVNTFNMIICRTYIQSTIGEEIIESAKIDGTSEFRILRSIIFPLSKPIIATLIIFYGVFHWNQWFFALLYLRNQDLHPLQLFLRRILLAASPELVADMAQKEMGRTHTEMQLMYVQMKYAVIVVAILPILFIYPFLQKHFVKGIMIGSLKG
jgi:putative aldouronate transport system permease protein